MTDKEFIMSQNREPMPTGPDVLRPSVVRQLLADSGFRPRKALGQNFLVDRNIRDLIVRAADVRSSHLVLEVGPGLGALTEALVERARQVVAVEKDAWLHAFLTMRFTGTRNLELLNADMLDVTLNPVFSRVVSNLPYAVGSRILVDLARASEAPSLIVVTVQKEVAERLTAKPSTPAYGLLSLLVQARYDAEIVHTIGPRCFFPEPEVRSAVVRLARRAGDVRPPEAFYALTRAAFAHRRKQVVRALAGDGRTVEQIRGALDAIGVAPLARPENLSAAQWRELAERLG